MFDEAERELLAQVSELGVPLQLTRLEEKEKILAYKAKDMVSRAVGIFRQKMERLNLDLPEAELQQLEEDCYTLLMFGYMLHSKVVDVSWESEFGSLFDGIGS